MNLTETSALLNGIAEYDNREVDIELAKLWHRHLADVPFADAAEAVHTHFDTSRDWLTIADVMNRIRATRTARMTSANLVYDGHPDETPEQYLANIRGRVRHIRDGEPTPDIARALGHHPVDAAVTGIARGTQAPAEVRQALGNRRHPARQWTCDFCRAQPPNACTNTANHRPLAAGPHPTRIAAWATATVPCPECGTPTGTECPIPDGPPQRTAHRRRIHAAIVAHRNATGVDLTATSGLRPDQPRQGGPR